LQEGEDFHVYVARVDAWHEALEAHNRLKADDARLAAASNTTGPEQQVVQQQKPSEGPLIILTTGVTPVTTPRANPIPDTASVTAAPAHEGSPTVKPAKQPSSSKRQAKKANTKESNLKDILTTKPAAGSDHSVLPEPVWSPVHESLHPTVSPGALSRFSNGTYAASKAERKLHARFFALESHVVSLTQEHPSSALRIFSADGTRMVKPLSVLADTGADLGLCISSGIAKSLGLTWKQGSANLMGVGGKGGALGTSDQRVTIRIGGNGKPTEQESTQLNGCFIMRLRPIIITDDLCRTIGHTSLIGQTVLRRCLASFDQLAEVMDISPAWMSHQCPEFRVSIPCKMSKDDPNLTAVFISDQPQRSTAYYLGEVDTPRAAMPVSRVENSKPASTPAKGKLKPNSNGTSPTVTRAREAVTGVLNGLTTTCGSKSSSPSQQTKGSKPSTSKVTQQPRANKPVRPAARSNVAGAPSYKQAAQPSNPKLAAPLQPGYPTSGPIPSKEEMAKHKAAQAERQRLIGQTQAVAANYNPAASANQDRPTCHAVIDLRGAIEEMRRVMNLRLQEFRVEVREEVDAKLRSHKIPAYIPSRSAPVSTLKPHVREVKPLANTNGTKPAPPPSTTQASTMPCPGVPAGGATKSKDPHDISRVSKLNNAAVEKPYKPEDKPPPAQPKAKLNRPAAPSTHGMNTRSRPASGITTSRLAVPLSWYAMKGGIPLQQQLVNKEAQSKRTKTTNSSPANASLLAVTLVAMVAGAQAQGLDTSHSRGVDFGGLTTQILSALIAAAIFRAVRIMAFDNLTLFRLVNANGFVLGVAWLAQVAGVLPSMAELWQAHIQEGWAAHAFVSAMVLLFALCRIWAKMQRTLERRTERS
jgi:hypothetical protein